MFRDAYRLRRCIVPVDGFFEWNAIKGQKAKQPYAIAMKDYKPFGLAVCRRTGRNGKAGEWIRTVAVIIADANEMLAEIHDCMPLILAPRRQQSVAGQSSRSSRRDGPFPSELMRMWPISTRVNKPENDDPSIVEPIELATDAA